MKKLLVVLLLLALLPTSAMAHHNKSSNYKCEKIQKYYDKWVKKGKEKYLEKWEKKEEKYCPAVVQPTVPDITKTVAVGNHVDLELPDGYVLESNPSLGEITGKTYIAKATVGEDVFTYYIVVNGVKSNTGTIKITIFDSLDF